MLSISLVVTTYNWKEALGLCLDSIATQRLRPLEVIVADDGSRVDTGELVRERARDFPVPLFHVWQEDRGFRASRVRNLGVAASSGDYVVFIDGDMVLHPHFIEDHATLIRPGMFLQGGRLNASAAESARILAGGAPRFVPWMPFAPGLRGELKPRHALRSSVLARRTLRSAHGGVVMSCNLGAWRADLDRINGFDDAYEGWGREDDDLAQRLRHAGVEQRRLRYAGLAIHLWHATRKPEAVPGGTPNERRLAHTIATRAVRCERGLDAHVRESGAAYRTRPVTPCAERVATVS